MQNEKGIWGAAERLNLLLAIIIALPAALSIIFSGWKLFTGGLTASAPAWALLAAIPPSVVLGYFLGRGKIMLFKGRFVKHVELYAALWEYDKLYKSVDGPFCTTCLSRMLPRDHDTRVAGRKVDYVVFACRNPLCEHRGAITRDLGTISTAQEAWRLVLDQLEAPKRLRSTSKMKRRG